MLLEYFTERDGEVLLWMGGSSVPKNRGRGHQYRWKDPAAKWRKESKFNPHGQRMGKCNGHISTDIRYFITSLWNIEIFSNAARKHSGIENSLH